MSELSSMSRRALFGSAAAAALLAAGCVSSQRGSGTGGEGSRGGSGGGGTFVFAAPSDPKNLDPTYTTDGESFRVARLQFEGLVGTNEGSAKLGPGLAEKWEHSNNGKTWTFTLKKGVKFSDGTPFNAQAAVDNFERWFNLKGILQSQAAASYWQDTMGAFKTQEPGIGPDPKLALYKSSKAEGEDKFILELNRYDSSFPAVLCLPALRMHSPKALKEYEADKATGSEKSVKFDGSYGTEHPTGTGPFIFEKWNRGQDLTLKRNDNYWGAKPKLEKVVYKFISDPNGRRQALESGTIDGYDLVAPSDLATLKSKGFQVLNRDPFTVLYLGFNPTAVGAHPVLKKVAFRKAVAHAINRETMITSKLPEGTKLASQFVPDSVTGWAKDGVVKYEYSVEKAKQFLQQSGYDGSPITFWYPTSVSRPYMPNPEELFEVVRADLEKVGIKITPIAKKWSPDYIDGTSTAQAPMFLLGWTGDYDDCSNWLGVHFTGAKGKGHFGITDPAIIEPIEDARKTPDDAARTKAWEECNRIVMKELPCIPLAHPGPSLAFKATVKGYVTSPVQEEPLNNVAVK